VGAVGIGQCASRDVAAEARVIELGLEGAQTRLDVAQAFAEGQLRESQAEELIPTREAAETTIWKVQTSWPAGVGFETFKKWCGTIKEQTGGELEFKPFAAKEVVGDFELLDGVKNGVLEAMNSFTLYWAGKLPATAFLSSYLMGLRYPHEWDVFFYSKGGIEAAREVFKKQGLMYVGRIHHGPNIIHSKKPIR
jgi:TRAP-type mannitol/chloroaromatic compound transport system substrate-binding protein